MPISTPEVEAGDKTDGISASERPLQINPFSLFVAFASRQNHISPHLRANSRNHNSDLRLKQLLIEVPKQMVSLCYFDPNYNFNGGDLVLCCHSTYPYWPAIISTPHVSENGESHVAMHATVKRQMVLAYWGEFLQEDFRG